MKIHTILWTVAFLVFITVALALKGADLPHGSGVIEISGLDKNPAEGMVAAREGSLPEKVDAKKIVLLSNREVLGDTRRKQLDHVVEFASQRDLVCLSGDLGWYLYQHQSLIPEFFKEVQGGNDNYILFAGTEFHDRRSGQDCIFALRWSRADQRFHGHMVPLSSVPFENGAWAMCAP